METAFEITFSNQLTAKVVRIESSMGLRVALNNLGFGHFRSPVLVIVGGASKLSQADYNRIRVLFFQVLAPLAQKWQACVVDGGTDAGVMQLMGQARAALKGTFPLVGVAPAELALLPNQRLTSTEAVPLEPNHTHFILIPGSQWGDESIWLSKTATALAGKSPSVTVLINGGEITWEDAFHNIAAGRVIIAVDGSGRTADLIAAGLRREVTDIRAEKLVASGLVQAIDLHQGTNALAKAIEEIFADEEEL